MTTKSKNKRIEVVSPHIECYGDKPVTLIDIINLSNGYKYQTEFKDYEMHLLSTDLQNCSVGIVITGQNKNLPPKRDNITGDFSTLNLNVQKEKLSFGNIFLYDSSLNILFYELNANGCYLDKLAAYVEDYWNKKNEHNKIKLSFNTVSRRGEYERLLKMGYYKEFYVELTNPTEILQDYNDVNDSLFSVAKHYIKNAVKSNSDTLVIKYSTNGKKLNKIGLSAKPLIDIVNSFRFLLRGEQRKNVKALKVKGYFTDPEESKSMQPVNLVSDVFTIFIKLSSKTLQSDLQETERKSEIEKVYNKYSTELKYIFRRDNDAKS